MDCSNFTEKISYIFRCSAEESLDANRAMPVVLLANKCDLAALKVPRHKYSSYVQENGLLAW